MKKPKKQKLPQLSDINFESKHVPVEYEDANGSWRVGARLKSSVFTDKQKGLFLNELRKHGRITIACRKSGTWPPHVKKERIADENFDEAFSVAIMEYHDRVIGHHQDLVFNGTQKKIYDRNGQLISEETQYPIRLVELELKKVDESYREKRKLEMEVSGGVLVAPAEMGSIADWEEKFVDADVIELSDSDDDQTPDEK